MCYMTAFYRFTVHKKVYFVITCFMLFKVGYTLNLLEIIINLIKLVKKSSFQQIVFWDSKIYAFSVASFNYN